MSDKISPPPRTTTPPRSQELTEAYKDLRDAQRSIRRFITAGNSGGVVATISLIGAIFGSQGGGPIPQGAFWLLVVFLTGLLTALGSLMFDAYMLDRLTMEGEYQHLEREFPRRYVPLSWEAPALLVVYRTMIWVSGIALVAGVLGSLVYLYGLTSP